MNDRRAAPRLSGKQPVQITVLNHPFLKMEGVVTDISDHGIRIVVSRHLPTGAPLRVDLENKFVFGEVRYCLRQGDKLAIGVEIQHSVLRAGQLAQFRSRFIGEPAPVELDCETPMAGKEILKC